MSWQQWVSAGLLFGHVVAILAFARHSRSNGYWTAWGDVFTTMRAHVKASPPGDIDAIGRVYDALGEAFERANRSGE